MIAAGGVLLWAFVGWQRHREAIGTRPARAPRPAQDRAAARRPDRPVQPEPDPDGRVLHDPALPAARPRARRARDRASRCCRSRSRCSSRPPSGSRLSSRFSVRTIVRAGLAISWLAVVAAAGHDRARARRRRLRARRWRVLGVGMGLIASQLGNVVQSSVDASGRGEAGGLQYTGQQLGSSLGVALIGAIVLAGLTARSSSNIAGRRAHQQRGRRPGRRRGGLRASTSSRRDQIEAAARRPGSTRRRPRRSSTTTSRRSSGAEGGTAGGGAARPGVPCVHGEPAAREPGDRRRRGRSWIARRRACDRGCLSPSCRGPTPARATS